MDASARVEQGHPTIAQQGRGISPNRTEAEHQGGMSPISFSRRAPTFHTSTIQRSGVIRIGIPRIDIPGIGNLKASFEQEWQEMQCARCRTMDFEERSSTRLASLGVSCERGQSRRTDGPSSPPPDGSSLYVVVGLFSAVDDQPHEIVIRIKNDEHLFRDLRWAIFRLRGLRYFLSLKSVRSFRVYKCLVSTGAHKHLELDNESASDLKRLTAAYKSHWVPKRVNSGWATWIHKCLNQDSTNILTDGAYSLEIVLGWSATRISVAILVPVILSLAIGCWFNSREWTDLGTIQAAWGIASYIATAGGLVAALLAIVSGLSDI
ncbi:hypothetical protein B0I35DRAFT_444682 [Stachybotrys elegans]|uniref:Uncharacterized protein n=1 Tax=Stachybotrys elegans TaxID=80388 RepID=A0A8K0SIK9_9HYPO|nr:hypothetical protein B0I35DRAFT_444682 [Stachybotrys elegans]